MARNVEGLAPSHTKLFLVSEFQRRNMVGFNCSWPLGCSHLQVLPPGHDFVECLAEVTLRKCTRSHMPQLPWLVLGSAAKPRCASSCQGRARRERLEGATSMSASLGPKPNSLTSGLASLPVFRMCLTDHAPLSTPVGSVSDADLELELTERGVSKDNA